MSTKSFRELFDEARQSETYWEERAVLDFTEDIYGRMQALGLTKSQLAERLGTSPAYVTKILGGGANFTLKTMVRLARALDASLDMHLTPAATERPATKRAGPMGARWEVTPEKVNAAVQRIVEVSHPRRLILFGSYVRGTLHEHSDLDVLVVTARDPENPRQESVRIRRALRGVGMPVDVLVVGEKTLEEAAEMPGLIYREALRNGRVVYDAAE